jgi:hypothetical protein
MWITVFAVTAGIAVAAALGAVVLQYERQKKPEKARVSVIP